MNIANFKAVFPFGDHVIERVTCSAIGCQIDLRRDRRRRLERPSCGVTMALNRETWHMAFDLPCGGGPITYVKYPATQGRCSSCGGYHTLRPPEIHPTRQATWRLMRYVGELARFVPMDAMAGVCGVPASTAYRYDRDVLEADLPEPDLDRVRAILVDEKSLGRRHGFVTIVLDADTGEMLHMHEGKRRASLMAFFDGLTGAQRGGIEAVCIDRAGAYKSAVEEALPGAEIVFDRFHLMQNLNRAIDEVRRAEHRGAAEGDRRVIKGSRHLLLRGSENLAPEGSGKLRKLLEINANLGVAHVLKEQFRPAWTYTYAGWARRFLEGWVRDARETLIPPLVRFANGVERDMEGIVSWCRHRITNGRIEGFNSIVSRVVLKARGIRSIDYLRLKLRQESVLQM